MSKAGRLGIKKFQLGGKIYLDIRRYIETPDGQPIPTNKGLSVPYEMLEDVLREMKEANGRIKFLEL